MRNLFLCDWQLFFYMKCLGSLNRLMRPKPREYHGKNQQKLLALGKMALGKFRTPTVRLIKRNGKGKKSDEDMLTKHQRSA